MRYTTLVAAALPFASEVLGTPLEGEEAGGRGYLLRKRVTCGDGIGPCEDGQCCSEGGYCGTSEDYCKSPQCQIQYSNGSCDSDQRPCGPSTADIPRNNDGDAPYDKYITTCTRDKTVALTFDDGPYLYTSALLDLLKEHDAKATFFISGNNIGKGQIDNASLEWPSLIRRAHAEGHQIASHTWSHLDLSSVAHERRDQELIYNEMALRNILGFFPKYLRPPSGTCTRDSGCLDRVTELGYHVITWDLDTKDYINNTPDTIQKSKDIFDRGFDGSEPRIVLSHDIQKTTVEQLVAYMLQSVKSKGFRTATVGECLGDPEENWYTQADTDEDCKIPDTPGCDDDSNQVIDRRDTGTTLTVSKDGTCGARSDNKYTCEGSKYGDCCSYNGFCGSTSGYCDGGCQSDFGHCNTHNCGDPPIVSQNGLCGGDTYQTCLDSSYGNCCSGHGNCGNTTEYCSEDKGCQSDWGECS